MYHLIAPPSEDTKFISEDFFAGLLATAVPILVIIVRIHLVCMIVEAMPVLIVVGAHFIRMVLKIGRISCIFFGY